jgi:adenylosuccinate lyase
LALVAAGSTREAAYRIVQRDARAAWESGRPLRQMLRGDPEVTLTEAQLDAAFDLEQLLRHAGLVVAALDEIDQVTR